MGRVVFITGTGTGVGKTVLTGLLLAHAQRKNIRVRPLKPIATGDRSDAELLWALLDRKLPVEQINPLFFSAPVTPLLAARQENATLTMSHLMALILAHETDSDLLLVEGAGGLMSPLGENFSMLELIEALAPEVIVAAHNKLGVLNHALLTVEVLKKFKIPPPRIALMNHGPQDPSQAHNESLLRELLPRNPLAVIPRMEPVSAENIRQTAEPLAERLEILLAERPQVAATRSISAEK